MERRGRIKLAAEICRVLVGTVFIFSGFVKAVDPMGFGYKIEEYLSSFGMFFLRPGAIGLSFTLIAIEFALGFCILAGVYRKVITFFTVVLMSGMTVLTLYLYIYNPVSDCGCFGDAIVLSNRDTFIKNIAILSAAVFMFINRKIITPAYPTDTRWFIPFFTLLYALVFSYWNYTHLPIIDFRPYKTGIHIPSQMQIPDNAPVDEFKYSFIYEKDGQKKRFTLDNYPANDTTWKFIDTEAQLIKKGKTPPIPSFVILDKDGTDVSSTILSYPDNIFLLISPKLEEADDDHINAITNLHEYASAHGIPFYCITGSSREAIEEWTELTGAEYPFLTADEILLKTIIRSNPGLLWLKDGIIMMKRHNIDVPDEKTASHILETGEVQRRRNSWIIFTLLTFSLPLLAVRFGSLICFTWKRKGKRFGKEEKQIN